MGKQISARIKKTMDIFLMLLMLLIVISLTISTISAAEQTSSASGIDLDGFPPSGNAPLTVSFWGTAPAYPASFYWDFGDGHTLTVPSTTNSRRAEHVYTKPGIYTVSLRATYPLSGGLSGGGSIVKPNYINVKSGINYNMPPGKTSCNITDTYCWGYLQGCSDGQKGISSPPKNQPYTYYQGYSAGYNACMGKVQMPDTPAK